MRALTLLRSDPLSLLKNDYFAYLFKVLLSACSELMIPVVAFTKLLSPKYLKVLAVHRSSLVNDPYFPLNPSLSSLYLLRRLPTFRIFTPTPPIIALMTVTVDVKLFVFVSTFLTVVAVFLVLLLRLLTTFAMSRSLSLTFVYRANTRDSRFRRLLDVLFVCSRLTSLLVPFSPRSLILRLTSIVFLISL